MVIYLGCYIDIMLERPEDIAETINLISLSYGDKQAIMKGLLEGREGSGSRRFMEGLVRVTDLLNPKRAYYSEVYPEIAKEIPHERRELMWAGVDFQVEFAYAVSQKEYAEQFVGMDGIIGRIDIFKDYPVEVKRTKDISGETDIVHSRPDNIEQLGMYCAMTNIKWGRLIFFNYKGEDPGMVYSFRIEFGDLGAIRKVMRERKMLLLDAWARRDPSKLPACPWFGRGCEAEKVCDCKDSKPFGYEIASEVVSCSFESEESNRLTKRLNEYLLAPKSKLTYWDLILPRKYWFRRDKPREIDDEPDTSASERLSWQNVKRGIEMQIKHTPEIMFKREYIDFDEEKFPVEYMRNIPTVITFPRFNTPLPPETPKISKFWREDILRLGMQCALANRNTGRLIAYYQNIKDINTKLEVYMIHFKEVETYREFMRSRIDVLRSARTNNDVNILPRCPEVKCRYQNHTCEYLDECQPDRDAL